VAIDPDAGWLICDVYSTATPCPMCQGALYWARIRRYHNERTPASGVAPKLAC
jgi:tRNA(Arg) A34 adenosine deaminase TadA